MPQSQLSYDPWETPPEERRARFVGHEGLLQRIVSAVAEQREHETVQHYLLQGPRGIGKTTLLLLLRDRVRESPALSARWFCVQFREEEYSIRTVRDLLYRVLDCLAEDEGLADAADLAERVHRERREDRSLAVAVDGLRNLAANHGRRILLLIDNFDRVFPATAGGRRKARPPENEFRAFRKLLSTESLLMVVGTSVRLFEEIAAYDRAFFNFFCPVEIPNLTDDEICELLRRCAAMEGGAALVERFDAMREKVRAITYVTGGNPRLVLMLYDVLRHREMMPVVQALRETVGGLTPLLKHVLDDMPRQQSKTLDALVRLRGAASPNDIARLARLPLNVVTVQLGRLKDARFVVVEGGGKGKPALYRLSDPMFHTWYQMRYLRPAGRRIELFVEFIRAWFSVEERRKFIEGRWRDLRADKRVREASLAIRYYAAALDDQRERQEHIGRLADHFAVAGKKREAAMLLAESAEPMMLSERSYESAGYRLLGTRILERGSLSEASAAFNEAMRKEEGEITDYTAVIELPGASADQIATALFNRGVTKGFRGDSEGEITDYTAVIELPGAPADQIAVALVNRGLAYGDLGDHQRALSDFQSAVELPAALPERRSLGLLGSGIAFAQLQRTADAIGRFEECVALRPGADSVHDASAWLIRLHLENGRPQEAARCMSRLHQIEPPETPTERRLEARISIITTAAKGHGPDAAALLLEASLQGDTEEVRARMAFLGPAIEYAKSGSEQALSGLEDRERDAAKQIAAAITGLRDKTSAN